jgi:type II secretory pathway component PulM
MNWRGLMAQGSLLANQLWQQREAREKRILMIGFVVLLCLGIYYFIWSPFAQYRNRITNTYTTLQQDIPYIAHTLKTYELLRQDNRLPHAPSSLPVRSQVSAMLAAQQLVPFGIKVTTVNSKQVKLVFKSLPFDMLITGVESLSHNQIFVTASQFNRTGGAGIVSGSVTLSKL